MKPQAIVVELDTPDQTALALYSCRTCGCALDYQGVGRPPAYCAEHRPGSFPPLRGVRGSHQLNGGVSGDVRGMVRRTDPQTSKDAAALANITAGTSRAKCLQALVEAGANGLTDFELGARVGRQQTSAGKRRGELVEAGFVENTHEKRPSPSKAFAAVWRATPEGIAKARELRDDT